MERQFQGPSFAAIGRMLHEVYGEGDWPHLRRRWLLALHGAFESHPEETVVVVLAAVKASKCKRQPAHWATVAIKARLTDRGLWPDSSRKNSNGQTPAS